MLLPIHIVTGLYYGRYWITRGFALGAFGFIVHLALERQVVIDQMNTEAGQVACFHGRTGTLMVPCGLPIPTATPLVVEIARDDAVILLSDGTHLVIQNDGCDRGDQ